MKYYFILIAILKAALTYNNNIVHNGTDDVVLTEDDLHI